MIRRRIVLAYWVVAFSLFMPTIALAYIDPATTTYIIQIVTALVITLGVTMSIALYKMKMIILNVRMKAFEIRVKLFSRKNKQTLDDEKNIKEKAMEDREDGTQYGVPIPRYEFNGALLAEVDKDFVPAGEIKAEKRKALPEDSSKAKKLRYRLTHPLDDDRTLRSRIVPSLLVSFAASFTVVIFGILDLVIANEQFFPFTLEDVFSTILLVGAILTVVVLVMLLVVIWNVYDLLMSMLLTAIVGGYIQGTFLNLDLGQLNGDPIRWQDYTRHGLINFAIWCAIFLAIIGIWIVSIKIWKKLCVILPSLIICVQVVALIAVFPASGLSSVGGNFAEPEKPAMIVSTKGMTEVSANNNVFVFLLDRLDQKFVEDVRNDDPHFFDRLDGFTMFTNNVTRQARTFPSVVSLLTEGRHYYERPGEDFMNETWDTTTFIPEIRDHGYTTKLYVEQAYDYDNTDNLEGKADNLIPESDIDIKINTKKATKELIKLSMFRYSPHVLKKYFWTNAGKFASARVVNTSASQYEPYVSDDYLMYRNIVENRLTVTEDEGNFAFYHMMGPHDPFTIDENVNRVEPEETSVLQQTKGSFEVVFEFIDQLKELGLYENSTIIIMADHGYADWVRKPLHYSILAGLFVKPAGMAGTPLVENDAPVSTDNFKATVMAGINGDLKDRALQSQNRQGPPSSGGPSGPSRKSGPPEPPGKSGPPEPSAKKPEVLSSETDKTYFDVTPEDNIVRRFFWVKFNALDDENDVTVLEEFEIRGHGGDFSNWKKVNQTVIDYWYG